MKDEKWIKIAESVHEIHFNAKGIARIKVAKQRICLVMLNGVLKACTDRCPHAGYSLSDGFIDAKENIVCCVHNYRFSLQHGRDSLNEGYRLKLYDVRLDGEGVWVRME